MTRMAANTACKDFTGTLNRVARHKERLVLSRRGRDVVAIVPVEDLDFLQMLEDRIDLDDARASLAESRKKGTIPWKKLKAELGL